MLTNKNYFTYLGNLSREKVKTILLQPKTPDGIFLLTEAQDDKSTIMCEDFHLFFKWNSNIYQFRVHFWFGEKIKHVVFHAYASYQWSETSPIDETCSGMYLVFSFGLCTKLYLVECVIQMR